MNTNETELNVDEREALIPWYVAGKLNPQERAQVDAYLAENPSARLQLELAGEEMDAAIVANELIDPPSARMLDRLMADVEAIAGPERQAGGAFARFMETLTGFLPQATPIGLRAATIAAALMIAVQGGTIAWLALDGQHDGGYRTASSGEQAAAGPGALITFQEDASAAQISALLEANGAQIVEGPKPGGVFVLRFKDTTMDEAAHAAAVTKLQAEQAIVKFAAAAN